MKFKKALSLLLVIVLAVCLVPSAYAKSVSELRQDKEDLQDQINSLKEQIESNQNAQEELQNEIGLLNEQISEAQAVLDEAQAAYDEAQADLEVAEAELAEAEEECQKQFDTFSERLRFIYESGDTGYMEVLLSSESLSDFLITMQYVNDIMEYDKSTLERLNTYRDYQDAKRQEVEEKRDEVADVLAEKEEIKASLDEVMAQKETKMNQYIQDEAALEKELKANQEASANVEKLINQALSSPSAANITYDGGSLGWPVPGRTYISSGYVGRERPIGSGYEFHTGIDIPAPYGYNIVAAEDGQVVTAGWVNGYGNTVIINHGSGLTTLYGHNSSLVVSVGDYVTRGQTIAKCGSTGNSTGNHCHFEVRVNGQHTNPWNYLGS